MGTDIACRVSLSISASASLHFNFSSPSTERKIHFHLHHPGWLAGKCLLNLNLIFAPKRVWEWMRQRTDRVEEQAIIAVLFRSRFFLIYFIFAYFIWFLNKLSQFYCLLFTAFHYTMSSIFIFISFLLVQGTFLFPLPLLPDYFAHLLYFSLLFLQRDVKILEPTGSDILSCVSKGKREVSFSRIIKYWKTVEWFLNLEVPLVSIAALILWFIYKINLLIRVLDL